MRKQLSALLAIVLVMAVLPFSSSLRPTQAAGSTIGYYDILAGFGTSSLLGPILATGGTPVSINTLSPTELDSVDVLFAVNSSNASYGAEYTTALPDIDTAIQDGLIFVLHDMRVTEAASQLPGGSGISFTRQLTNDVDVLNASVGDSGPYGSLDNDDLDNGDQSAHGYADRSTLPAGATCYLIMGGAPSQCVSFSYPYGDGLVYYSTIPLPFFLAGFGDELFRNTLLNIYAPNITYGAIVGNFGPTSVVLRAQNNGEVTVYASAPVMVYEQPGGNPVRVSSGSELFLPHDADGSGFDTHLLNKAYTYDGELWLQIFIGGDHYVFIRAADVNITRGQLPESPTEWVN